ncbi:hypothetical protein V5O48_015271 [Marasmius crinis-equi]|uniref:Uncharacterized protein n=1 Tax=Marasmius crinis-equi TaxID=585013 RepID=A0ABR3EV00_9AGAR
MSTVPAKRSAPDTSTPNRNVRQRVRVKIEVDTQAKAMDLDAIIHILQTGNRAMQKLIEEHFHTINDAIKKIAQERNKALDKVEHLEDEIRDLNVEKRLLRHMFEEEARKSCKKFESTEKYWDEKARSYKNQLRGLEKDNEALRTELKKLEERKKNVRELSCDGTMGDMGSTLRVETSRRPVSASGVSAQPIRAEVPYMPRQGFHHLGQYPILDQPRPY